MDEKLTEEEFLEADDWKCSYCPLPEEARGTHLYPGGHYSCEGAHCKEAYENYMESQEV